MSSSAFHPASSGNTTGLCSIAFGPRIARGATVERVLAEHDQRPCPSPITPLRTLSQRLNFILHQLLQATDEPH